MARLPERSSSGLNAVTPGDTVIAAMDSFPSLKAAFTPGKPDPRPVMSVRSRGTPPLTMEPLLSLPIAVVEDQVMIVAEPGLRDDNRCRLFITDLPAR